jgi:hypothetical protein
MRQGFVFGFVFLGTASSLDGSCPEMYDNTRFVFHSAPRHGTRQVVRLAYDSQDRKEVALKFSDTVPGNKLIARDHASYERELPHARRELQVASKLIAGGAHLDACQPRWDLKCCSSVRSFVELTKSYTCPNIHPSASHRRTAASSCSTTTSSTHSNGVHNAQTRSGGEHASK